MSLNRLMPLACSIVSLRVWEGSGFVQDDYRHQTLVEPDLRAVRYDTGLGGGQFGDKLGRQLKLPMIQIYRRMQTRRRVEVSMLHRALQFSGRSPGRCDTCKQYIWKLWGRTEHDRSRIGFAWQTPSLANDKSHWCCEEGTACTTLGRRPGPLLNPCLPRRSDPDPNQHPGWRTHRYI